MTDNTYQPAKVWTWDKSAGGAFASINRPVSGPTHEKTLPVGKHPLQLYSLGTPNGQKVTIMLEELLALQQTLGLVEQQLVLPQVQLVLRQILGLVGFLEPLLLLEILLQPVLEQFLLH